MLKGSLDRVNRLQTEADANISDLATGKQTDIHQTMIAVEKADVSFELLMQIRNKLIAAYDKIMRMPV
jgi:flagellar hook-basal body complex protein FliE